MATVIEMPKLGNTVEECFLTAWRKQEGEAVAPGEVLADIETDKTVFELTTPVGGILLARLFDAGALVPVYTPVCVVGEAGESVEPFRPQGGAPPAPAVAGEERAGVGPPPEGGAEPPAQVAAAARDEDAGVGPSPEGGAEPPAQVAGAAAPPSHRGGGNGTSMRLSPRARRYQREHGPSAEMPAGSGAGGRVLEADLRALHHATMATPPTADAAAGGPGTPASALSAEAPPPDAEVARAELTLVRRTIAQRLRESRAQTVQYTLHTSANAASLLALRRRLKAVAETAGVTIGDIVACCTIRALLEVPEMNAELIDGAVQVHRAVHLGFACDTPRGLLVPVVRDSQNLSLRGLSRRIKELTAQAVAGSIAADDLAGGTFTITNLGSLGIEVFTPVLNPPQVAVLGVDGIQVKPVRKPDGNLEFIDAIGLSLTVDHQVVDGAPGARFLGLVRDRVERAEAVCTI